MFQEHYNCYRADVEGSGVLLELDISCHRNNSDFNVYLIKLADK